MLLIFSQNNCIRSDYRGFFAKISGLVCAKWEINFIKLFFCTWSQVLVSDRERAKIGEGKIFYFGENPVFCVNISENNQIFRYLNHWSESRISRYKITIIFLN